MSCGLWFKVDSFWVTKEGWWVVSHGGAESSHQAMYDGVPMIILSFFG